MRTPQKIHSPAGAGENRQRGGFTLIEMMVVVAIIVLLAGILMAVGSMVLRGASNKATRATLTSLDNAMSLYLKDHPEPGVAAPPPTTPQNYPAPPAVNSSYHLQSNDWILKLSANPETAKLLEKLKPIGTGTGRQILDGFGKPILYLPSNLDLAATTGPGDPIYNPTLHTPGRFVSFGADSKPDSKALGATTPITPGDDLYSNGASVAP